MYHESGEALTLVVRIMSETCAQKSAHLVWPFHADAMWNFWRSSCILGSETDTMLGATINDMITGVYDNDDSAHVDSPPPQPSASGKGHAPIMLKKDQAYGKGVNRRISLTPTAALPTAGATSGASAAAQPSTSYATSHTPSPIQSWAWRLPM
ncbi:hypothetical protein Pcinc_024087 [Petrolisthes cinctipes]|uniref:Uncharacterized protein n=1 Tax=Petrolisthes cinctipes TaxID=88211 RepID=A0AAE1FBM3_PETCI|nr:hypothetical protein Pcinc_024087 [Petrolisthes cinctipes]